MSLLDRRPVPSSPPPILSAAERANVEDKASPLPRTLFEAERRSPPSSQSSSPFNDAITQLRTARIVDRLDSSGTLHELERCARLMIRGLKHWCARAQGVAFYSWAIAASRRTSAASDRHIGEHYYLQQMAEELRLGFRDWRRWYKMVKKAREPAERRERELMAKLQEQRDLIASVKGNMRRLSSSPDAASIDGVDTQAEDEVVVVQEERSSPPLLEVKNSLGHIFAAAEALDEVRASKLEEVEAVEQERVYQQRRTELLQQHFDHIEELGEQHRHEMRRQSTRERFLTLAGSPEGPE